MSYSQRFFFVAQALPLSIFIQFIYSIDWSVPIHPDWLLISCVTVRTSYKYRGIYSYQIACSHQWNTDSDIQNGPPLGSLQIRQGCRSATLSSSRGPTNVPGDDTTTFHNDYAQTIPGSSQLSPSLQQSPPKNNSYIVQYLKLVSFHVLL